MAVTSKYKIIECSLGRIGLRLGSFFGRIFGRKTKKDVFQMMNKHGLLRGNVRIFLIEKLALLDLTECFSN